ncbi:hypothetical protein GW796_05895 [archaeon]|nr:hypothetical protein [archaeon]NCQ51416.1 hypothetical protein [archaeon]NCT58758.1 hypothetical protein [archaeon]
MKETMIEKLYKKFSELREEAVEDCKFIRTELDNSFNNTNKIIKYINLKCEWNRVNRKFELERKQKYRKLYEFYQTDYPLKINTKDEYQLFIESDSEYYDIQSKSQITKEIIIYIDSVLDALKGRGYEIKNCLEWEKFKNGQ